MKRLLFLLIFQFSIALHAQTLPAADYPKTHPSSAAKMLSPRDWFTIRIIHDSISCRTDRKTYAVHAVSEIEAAYCAELQQYAAELRAKQARQAFLNIKIEADSATRYALVDEIVATLQHLHRPAVFLRTAGPAAKVSGFLNYFPEVEDSVRPYQARLYGQHLLDDYDLVRDCLGERSDARHGSTLQVERTSIEPIKTALQTGQYGQLVLIELSKGIVLLNKKPVRYSDLAKMIEKPKQGHSFYIVPGPENSYGEIIKLLDFYSIHYDALSNATARRLFGRDLSQLDSMERFKVMQEEPPVQWILTLAERAYLMEQ